MNNFICNNYSRYTGKKQNYDRYAWCVFLQASRAELREVESVEYVLHPTFPDPVRRISDRDHCFALESRGWGIFTIQIKIQMTDDKTERGQYRLRLERDEWPKGDKLERFPDLPTQKTYEALFDNRYQWRKLSTLCRIANLSQEDARQILSSLQEQRLVRKAYYESLDDEELWGATNVVGLLPEPTE